jgi:glycosyltransferase involved in cell wall biosynthesis
MRWALNRCNAVISNARATAERVAAISGFPVSNIAVIPNGVEAPCLNSPAESRAAIRKELGLHTDAILVGSVGRLVPVKDFGLAIDAIATVRKQQLNVHLLLVGDGPERGALEDQARQIGVADSVHFAGHQEDVWRYFNAMDLYINSSQSEGLSQSLIEALAIGLPVVVTDVGDSAWVARELPACGAVIPPGDASAMANQIWRLSQEPLLRSELGKASSNRFAKHFSIESMTKSYASLYRSLAAGSERGSAA